MNLSVSDRDSFHRVQPKRRQPMIALVMPTIDVLQAGIEVVFGTRIQVYL